MDQREELYRLNQEQANQLPTAGEARKSSQEAVDQAVVSLQVKAAAAIKAAAAKGEFSIWLAIPSYDKVRTQTVSMLEAAGYKVKESTHSHGSFSVSWDSDSANLH